MLEAQHACSWGELIVGVRVLQFGAFTLDEGRRVLLQDGAEIELRSQSFDVLDYLVERGGRVVSKQELFDAVWGGAARTDDSLVQCVKDIRQALGDSDHRLIKTVHRRGYLFAGDVTEAATVAPEGAPTAAASIPDSRSEPAFIWQAGWLRAVIAAGLLITVMAGSGWLFWTQVRPDPPVTLVMMPVPSVAVLPFQIAGEARKPSDAMRAFASDVETELSRTPSGYSMRIRAAPGYKAHVENPKDIGHELGVRYLVTGSIRRQGDATQVNVQLIEAEGNRPVWAEPFQYATDDAQAQNRTAARIARMINHHVLKAEVQLPLPAQPEAGHFVMIGRSLMSGQRGVKANKQAMAFFERALALDANSVPALQGYARTKINHVLNNWVAKEQRSAWLDEAEAALTKAIRLDPRNPGLHVARGAYLRAMHKDAEAIAAFQLALDLYPNYPLAHGELGRAKIEVGLARETAGHIQEAINLSRTEPYRAAWYYWAAMAEVHVERNREAIGWLLKLRNENRAYPNTVPWLAIAYAGLGEWEEARAYMEEHLRNFPRFSLSRWRLALPHGNPTVAAQRERIEALLRRLGAQENSPAGEVETGSVPDSKVRAAAKP